MGREIEDPNHGEKQEWLKAKFGEFFAAKRCITTSQLSDLLRSKFWCEVLKKMSVGSYAGFMMMIIMYSATICKY